MDRREANIEIRQVPRSTQNRRLFRQLARDSCGETFESPEEETLFFAHQVANTGARTLIGVASCVFADEKLQEPGIPFLNDYFHCVSYVFVKAWHKGFGYGTQILEFMEKKMMARLRRPIRTQAARKAVVFFERMGYGLIGEPMDCVCSGSPLFSRLYNMQK